MNSEDALVLADALFLAQTGQHLNDLQRTLLRAACAPTKRLSYRQIAQDCGYSESYLKYDVGPDLWQSLSEILQEKVSKTTVRSALERQWQAAQTFDAPLETVASPATSISWGEAIDVSVFYGRETELRCLEDWVIQGATSALPCRLVAILGMGGVGKTALSVKLTQRLAPRFEQVVWRSLRNAPPLLSLLRELLRAIAPATLTDRLDSVATALPVLLSSLLRLFGEVPHQSCLVLTSREKPQEIAHLEGDRLPVRSFLLEGLEPSQGEALLRAKGDFYAAPDDFSPNGRWLASGGDDQMDNPWWAARLWDVATGTGRHQLAGHQSWVQSVAFSPDSRYLATGSCDHTIRLWDVQTGACLRVLRGHQGRLWCVAFSPCGRLLASSSDDQTVRLWEVATGTCQQILRGHQGWVQSVTFAPDGQWLASGSSDRSIRLWHRASGYCRAVLTGHQGWVRAVAFAPASPTALTNPPLLASGSSDQTIRLWNWQTHTCQAVLRGHTNWVRGLAFGPDGQFLVSGSQDETIGLWQVANASLSDRWRTERPYEQLDISGTTGLTPLQTTALTLAGAVQTPLMDREPAQIQATTVRGFSDKR